MGKARPLTGESDAPQDGSAQERLEAQLAETLADYLAAHPERRAAFRAEALFWELFEA